MAYRKIAEEATLQQKVKVLTKLFDTGCKTEKALQSLSIESILAIDGITIQDMAVITELQKRVKNHSLFSYLGGENGENTEQKQ